MVHSNQISEVSILETIKLNNRPKSSLPKGLFQVGVRLPIYLL